MRFIDNGRTVPQVLKASPPLSTLSSSPRSRGMHPIIGTLSVFPRGDNDALPPDPTSPSPSLSLSLFSFLHPNHRFPLPALGSQSLAKNLIYPLCSALPSERRAERKRRRGGKRKSERDRWNRIRKRKLNKEKKRWKRKGHIYSCFRFLARAGYALRYSCKTCLLRRIPVFSPPSFSPLFSSRSLPLWIGGRAEWIPRVETRARSTKLGWLACAFYPGLTRYGPRRRDPPVFSNRSLHLRASPASKSILPRRHDTLSIKTGACTARCESVLPRYTSPGNPVIVPRCLAAPRFSSRSIQTSRALWWTHTWWKIIYFVKIVCKYNEQRSYANVIFFIQFFTI